jgi:hypothetical protein
MKVGTRNFQKSFYSKLANKIVEKPMSFYKFGLKEDEKVACKSVFKELFHVKIYPNLDLISEAKRYIFNSLALG